MFSTVFSADFHAVITNPNQQPTPQSVEILPINGILFSRRCFNESREASSLIYMCRQHACVTDL